MKTRFFLLSSFLFGGIVIALILFQQFSKKEFYNDRLIIFFQDETEGSSAIVVNLTRYSILPFYYQHQYSVTQLGSIATHSEYYESSSRSNSIVAGGFLKNFSNSNNYNVQAESYSLKFEIDGQNYEVNLGQMSGDFIINNSLQRLTYVNLGPTTLTIDGRQLVGDFALTKTLSSDSEHSTVDDTIVGSGNNIFITDRQDNIYLVDSTNITQSSGGYDSHNWILRKHNDVLQKFVGLDFALSSEDGNSITLDVESLSDARITLRQLSSNDDNQITYYLLDGYSVDNLGEHWLGGLQMTYDY